MKRLFTYTIAIICCCIIGSTVSKAQAPQACTPDCDTNWVYATLGPVNIPMCDTSCWVMINYAHRTACGFWHDVQITQITALGPGCNNCPTDLLYQRAFFSVVAWNAMGWFPQRDVETGCTQIWRAVSAACAARWLAYIDKGTYVDTTTIIRRCTGSTCCLQPLKVCRYRVGSHDSVVITPQSTSYPAISCDTTHPVSGAPYPPGGTTCFPMCDMLSVPISTLLSHSFGTVSVEEQEAHLARTTVYPNPTSGTAKIDIDAPEAGYMNVVVVSLTGEVLARNTQLIAHGVNHIEINTAELASGTYIYRLEFGGSSIISGKIVVEK